MRSSIISVPRGVSLRCRPSLRVLLSPGLLLPILCQTLVAQSGVSTTPEDTTLAARLATITTDTGAFAPGHQNYGQYTTPGMCRAAAHMARDRAQVSLLAQATHEADLDRNQDQLEDTMGTGAAAGVARACGGRFTLATTPTRDLSDLFELAVYARNETLAPRTLAALLAQQASWPDSLAMYQYGLHQYLSVGWRPMALALLAQVDAPGAGDVQRWKAMLLWDSYLEHAWTDVANFGSYRSVIDRELQLYASLPRRLQATSNGYSWFVIDWAWHWLVRSELDRGTPVDSFYAIARTQKLVIDGMDDTLRARMLREHHAEVQKNRTLDGLMFGFEPLIPRWASYPIKANGLAPRLTADYWFPAPGRPARDTVRPVPNKVNVLCTTGEPTDVQVFNGIGVNAAYNTVREMRRWVAKYGAENLEVTLIRPARGFDQMDLYRQYNIKRLWATPAAEAEAWRWYVQDYEHFPVTVAVQVRTDQWFPAPDGRRAAESRVQFADYFDTASTEHAGTKRPSADSNQVNDLHMHNMHTDGLSWDLYETGHKTVACVVVNRDGYIVYASGGRDAWTFEPTERAVRWAIQHGGGTRTTATDPSMTAPPETVRMHADSAHGGTQ